MSTASEMIREWCASRPDESCEKWETLLHDQKAIWMYVPELSYSECTFWQRVLDVEWVAIGQWKDLHFNLRWARYYYVGRQRLMEQEHRRDVLPLLQLGRQIHQLFTRGVTMPRGLVEHIASFLDPSLRERRHKHLRTHAPPETQEPPAKKCKL